MTDTSKEATDAICHKIIRHVVDGTRWGSEGDLAGVIDTIRALSAERAHALGDNRILRTEKQADAEAIATMWDINAENDRLRVALKISEAALSDIGDADREDGDDLAWCERGAAKAIPIARAALKGENTDE